MKKFMILLISLAITFYCTNSFTLDKTSIDLYEYLRLARQNDVEIKKILHDRVQTGFLKDLSLPSSAIILSVENEYGFAIGDGGRTTVLQIGAEKPIQTTGTTLSATYGINKQEDREERGTSITVEQSLFRNGLGKKIRKQNRKLEKENEALLLTTLEAYEDYVAAIILNYLDWQLTHLNMTVAKSLLKESQTLRGFIEERKKRNIAASVDVGKITLESLGYKEALLELEVSLSRQISAISATIGYSKSGTLIPADKLQWVQLDIDLNTSRQEAIESSRMIKAYALAEEAGQLEISIRKEDLNPELNLIFGFNYDNSTRFNVTTNRKEIFVGFNLELPIWETQKGAEVKQAKYEKIASSLAKEQYSRNLISSLDSQISRIKTQRERVDLNKKRWELAESVAKKEMKRYENGKIDLETLILARQAVAKNQFSYLSNEIQLNKDLVEWLRLSDKLVVKDEIILKNSR